MTLATKLRKNDFCVAENTPTVGPFSISTIEWSNGAVPTSEDADLIHDLQLGRTVDSASALFPWKVTKLVSTNLVTTSQDR